MPGRKIRYIYSVSEILNTRLDLRAAELWLLIGQEVSINFVTEALAGIEEVALMIILKV